MKVLVTGGAGYIGSHVARHLHEAGFETVILDDFSTGHRDNIVTPSQVVQGDVGDVDLVRELLQAEKIRSVAHFAASIVVPESVEKPLLYYENNVVNSLRLLQACTASGVEHFLFSSSAAVYGHGVPSLIKENQPLAPITPYGHTKAMVEQVLEDVSLATPLRAVRLRYFNVAGADPQGRHGQRSKTSTHLIKVGCETALGKRPYIEVYGTDYATADGTCIRDYIHIEDLAQAHALALKNLLQGGPSAAYNVGYGQGRSVREVIESIKRVAKTGFEVKQGPRRPGDPAFLAADGSLLRKNLGWKPQFDDLDRIVHDAWNWECRLSGRKT